MKKTINIIINIIIAVLFAIIAGVFALHADVVGIDALAAAACAMAVAPLLVLTGSETLTQLTQKRSQLLEAIEAITKAPEGTYDADDTTAEKRWKKGDSNGEFTQEQRDRLAAYENELDQLDAKIDRKQTEVDRRNKQAALEQRARSTDLRIVPDVDRGHSPSEMRDLDRFSLGRALRLASEGRSIEQIDGVEGEMLQEGSAEARASGITPHGNGFIVGSVALSRGEQRDHTVGTAIEGGNTVQTTVGTLLDALMEQLVFNRLGADVNTGLVGNLTVNRIVRGTPPAEKSENAAADEHSITFEPVTLSPRRLPTYLDISNQLFIQSQERNLERRITNHVTSEISILMEISYIADILATSGIGDIAGGPNGKLPTYSDIVNIVKLLKVANVNPNQIKYLINSAVESYLMQAPLTVDSGGEPIGDGKILPSGATRLAGRDFETSNVVPSDLDKGTSVDVCSAIIAGDFSGVTIGQWSGIEFLVDPFTQAVNGMRRIHAAVYHDSVVTDPAKLSAMQDALTE